MHPSFRSDLAANLTTFGTRGKAIACSATSEAAGFRRARPLVWAFEFQDHGSESEMKCEPGYHIFVANRSTPLSSTVPSGTIRSMLIPRLTIRGILIAMIGFGFLSVVLADAVRGRPWAMAFTAALLMVVVLAFLFAALFLCSLLLVQLVGVWRSSSVRTGSPFASAGPPPQVIPPEEPVE